MASTADQKGIRNRIRDLKFYFSDFSKKKGYTVDDFDQLIRTGQIKITGEEHSQQPEPKELRKKPTMKTNLNAIIRDDNIEQNLIAEENYISLNPILAIPLAVMVNLSNSNLLRTI